MMKSNSQGIAIAMAVASFTAVGCGSAPAPIPVSLPAAIAAPAGPVGMMSAGGSCIPLTQSIGFQAQRLYSDNFQTVYAGYIPYVDKMAPGQQFGGVIQSVGGGVIGPVAGSRFIQTLPNRPDGSVTMNISTGGVAGFGTGMGLITISPAKLAIIYGLFGLNYPNVSVPYSGAIPQSGFPSLAMPFYSSGMTPTQMQAQTPCVSGIAISLSYASLVDPGTSISGGRVYLYLNNTTHGDILQF